MDWLSALYSLSILYGVSPRRILPSYTLAPGGSESNLMKRVVGSSNLTTTGSVSLGLPRQVTNALPGISKVRLYSISGFSSVNSAGVILPVSVLLTRTLAPRGRESTLIFMGVTWGLSSFNSG